MRLLLACADPAAARRLGAALEAQRWVVDRAGDAEEAFDFAFCYDHDAVLVADGPPGMAAHEAVRRLRAKGVRAPALVLSGSDRSAERVRALSAGADDVVAKGVETDELVARLRAITRRARGHAQGVLRVGPVTLDQDTREVRVGDRPVALTAKEFALLELLVLRRGTVMGKDAILNQLYGGLDEPEAKIVDVFVCKMRKKLADAGAPDVVGTVWGRGYVVREPAGAAQPRPAAGPAARPAAPAEAEPAPAGAGCGDVREPLGLD